MELHASEFSKGYGEKGKTYFNVEQNGNDVCCAKKHGVYFSNYIIHVGWIEPFLPGPNFIVSSVIARVYAQNVHDDQSVFQCSDKVFDHRRR